METEIRKRARRYGIAAVLLAIALGMAVDTFAKHTIVIPEEPPLPPVASFSVLQPSVCYITWTSRPGEVAYNYPTFTFRSTSSVRKGSITNYIWDFGDGTTSSGLSVVTHTYQNPGIYNVILTVVSDKGLESTTYRTLKIFSAQTTLSVDSSEDGGILTVDISILDVDNLGAWQAGFQVDPEALECVSFEKTNDPSLKDPLFEGYEPPKAYLVSEGLFRGTPGETIWIHPKIDNTLGRIGPAGCCLAPGQEGASGDGILATVSFRVLNSGPYALEFIDVLLLNREGKEIPFNIDYGDFESG